MKETIIYSNHSHSFSRTIAKKYGVNAAIVFGYLSYKIRNSKNERDGQMWYYGSIEQICKPFPYLKRSTVYKAITRLTSSDGPITCGNYNRKRYDRTLWYSFRTKEASELVDHKLAYFKVEDALLYDVAKAVLMSNLRYWINANKAKASGYCMHQMSPTDLARILPFSRATIARKLHALVWDDKVLVSLTDLERPDLREPSKYGFLGEVAFHHDIGVSTKPTTESANKSTHLASQSQICKMAGSNPNMSGSNPNTGRSKPNDYTTLEIPLKETIGEKELEGSEPLLRRASELCHTLSQSKTFMQLPPFLSLLAVSESVSESTQPCLLISSPASCSDVPEAFTNHTSQTN